MAAKSEFSQFTKPSAIRGGMVFSSVRRKTNQDLPSSAYRTPCWRGAFVSPIILGILAGFSLSTTSELLMGNASIQEIVEGYREPAARN